MYICRLQNPCCIRKDNSLFQIIKTVTYSSGWALWLCFPFSPASRYAKRSPDLYKLQYLPINHVYVSVATPQDLSWLRLRLVSLKTHIVSDNKPAIVPWPDLTSYNSNSEFERYSLYGRWACRVTVVTNKCSLVCYHLVAMYAVFRTFSKSVLCFKVSHCCNFGYSGLGIHL